MDIKGWVPNVLRDEGVRLRSHVVIPRSQFPRAIFSSKPMGLTRVYILLLLQLCNAYTELNNPVVQRQRFLDQSKASVAGDDEAQVRIDRHGRTGAVYDYSRIWTVSLGCQPFRLLNFVCLVAVLCLIEADLSTIRHSVCCILMCHRCMMRSSAQRWSTVSHRPLVGEWVSTA